MLRIVNVFFFPIGIVHRSAMQLLIPSTPKSVLRFFGGFASLSRHLAFIEQVENYGLATAITFFEAPQPGYATNMV